ncbi:MAG: ADP-ribosylglycohydrolase family protein [Candidatus Bruticola sp.]
MIGAIIGDIIGSIYEWKNGCSVNFKLFDPKCRFTDDSVMTIAVGQAIMEFYKQGFILNYEGKKKLADLAVHYMRKMGRTYPRSGYGGRFKSWLRCDNPQPYNSFGNGAAMRISTAGWAAANLNEALELAEVVTAVTHNHPEGIKGAQATTAAIFLARQGKNKQEIKAYINQHFYNINFTLDELRLHYKADVTCMHTVPLAIEAFIEASDLEGAVRLAISLGGDSDTLAAITGSIAEAFYGVPSHIENEAIKFLDNNLKSIYEEWCSFQNKRAELLQK